MMVSNAAFVWKKSWKPTFTVLIPFLLSPILLWEGVDVDEPDCSTCEPKWKQAGGAFVIILMSAYWISECLPLPVTALIPIVLYPFFEISSTEEVTRSYLNSSVLLLLAGCIIALAFEFSNLHTRIALKVITIVGAQIPRLLFGIMATAMFLSMWMNNTSTTAMMVPIVYVIMEEFEHLGPEESEVEAISATNSTIVGGSDPEEHDSKPVVKHPISADNPPKTPLLVEAAAVPEINASSTTGLNSSRSKDLKEVRDIKIMFLLGVAAAANIGGTGVITGTATNVIAQNEAGKKRIEIMDSQDLVDKDSCDALLMLDFLGWMKFNILPTLLCTVCSWAILLVYSAGLPKWLTFWRKLTDAEIKELHRLKKLSNNIENAIRAKYSQLGPLSLHEIFVLSHFLLLVLLWITEVAWFQLFTDKDGKVYPHDSTPALFVCLLLFVIPKEKKYYKDFLRGSLGEGMKDTVLKWEFVETKVPWGPLVLIGGGSAISQGIRKSGVGDVIGKFLKYNEVLNSLKPWQFMIIILVVVAFLTTVASNTATASILSPVLISLAFSKNIHPLYLLIVPTVTASYAFILPISTPPNAIVFEKSDMKQSEMAIPGIVLTIACNFIMFVMVHTYDELLFDFTGYEHNPSCGQKVT